MNFAQMHERLRLELLRRIQRGSLSVSLLARQTGFGQGHLSNFLHARRQLSLDAMDRILNAQHLAAADLLPAGQLADSWLEGELGSAVPVVSHATALFEPMIRPSAINSLLHLPASALKSVRARATSARRAWHRFVAVRVPAADALPMEPLLLPDAIVLIDRQYNSLAPYRPNRPNLYAVGQGAHLTFRYVEYFSGRLVLRPLNLTSPVELLEVAAGGTPYDLIVGRIVFIMNEL
jgi:hypothetical protein